MRKPMLMVVLMTSVFLLQGCARQHQKPVAAQPVTADKMAPLEICLNEAKTLAEMNNQYQKQVNELYTAINDAKFYASISNRINSGVSATITPLYDYTINEKCNAISQNLMKELKAKVIRTTLLKNE